MLEKNVCTKKIMFEKQISKTIFSTLWMADGQTDEEIVVIALYNDGIRFQVNNLTFINIQKWINNFKALNYVCIKCTIYL